MKCPNDQTDMEEGILGANGTRWIGKGFSEKLAKASTGFLTPGPFIYAHRCLKCGKIELTTEVK